MINELVTNPEVTAELVDKVDWVIVPNVNPDGKNVFEDFKKFYYLFFISKATFTLISRTDFGVRIADMSTILVPALI